MLGRDFTRFLGPLLIGLLLAGAGVLAWKSQSAAPILAAGGIVLLGLLVKYAHGEASKAEIERQIRATLKDPEKADAYLELLEDEEILESLRKVA